MYMGTFEDLFGRLTEIVDNRRGGRLLTLVLDTLEIDGSAVRQWMETVVRCWITLLPAESQVDPVRQVSRDVVRL